MQSIIFDRNLQWQKNKSETWTESVENAAQISGHDTFSKMTGFPLSSANILKA